VDIRAMIRLRRFAKKGQALDPKGRILTSPREMS
jgi:hypothetical protein